MSCSRYMTRLCIHFCVWQLEETRNFDYIVANWENGKEKATFIQTLNHHWPNIFESILDESSLTDAQKQKYVIDTFYYSLFDDIEEMNVNRALSNYINSNPAFLDIESPNVEAIVKGFQLLDIKFRAIDYASANKGLFIEVYKRDMYVFSLDNILAMLRNVYNIECEEIALIQASLTMIFKKPEEPLSKYVEQNIDSYLNSVLESCKEQINDNEDIALRIINHPSITVIEDKVAKVKIF